MKQPLFIFKAVNGNPQFAEQSEIRFREHLKQHENKVYEVYLRESKRSLSQNSYYWLYLGIIEESGSNTALELHELFRRTLLPPKFITVRGKELKVPASTTELTKNEMSEYLEKICAETLIPLPDPIAAGYIK